MSIDPTWAKETANNETSAGPSPRRIMSGDYSSEMWRAINEARTIRDLREALYFVCCRLQEMEERCKHGSTTPD